MTPPPGARSATAEADAALMRRALVEARRAPSTRDVPIGALVVGPTGDVVAGRCNRREADGDPTAHAEIMALREASGRVGTWNLSGYSLVVTCEPCTMCAGAAVAARVSTLVFGCWEPKTGAVGSLWDVVRDRRLPHRLEVRPGVLADECAALLEQFFAERR